jgi:hypothetical protein
MLITKRLGHRIEGPNPNTSPASTVLIRSYPLIEFLCQPIIPINLVLDYLIRIFYLRLTVHKLLTQQFTCPRASDRTAKPGNCPPPPEFLLEQPDTSLGLGAVPVIIRLIVRQDTQ